MCISLLFGEHFNILNDRKSGELNVFREWKTGGNVLYNDINLLPFDCFSRKEWWRGCITLNTTKSNERNSSELIVLCFYSIWLLFLTYFIIIFHFCRFCVVIRGFSSPPQRPMTSDFEGFSIPDLIHHIYFPILILEKEPVVSLLNVQC